VDDDSDDGSVDDDSSTTTSAATAAPFTETYRIGDAGTVTLDFDGSILTILGTSAAEGWYVEIDAATGTEVEAEFSDGTTEFEFEAEFEHGEVRVSIGQTEH
ncbi:MAG: hypothetical protein KQH83_03000, partial [Actinobacteria bacterium]|nr:hypothetical protein [Actinomycetota bacterium]